jgi:ATP-dependent DNA ligase
MKSFPKLYKKTTTGAIQEWQVRVEELDGIPTIINNYGQVDGKIQESKEQVLEGKNTGRANATTALEQAEAQAKSRWEKQLKRGYVETIEDAQAGKINAIIEGGIFPMLAHKFSEQGHKIKYPALCQPKLDGNRCIYQKINEFGSLWSRTRKSINSVPHIINAIDNAIKINYLDGELYCHDYRSKFEELTSFIRQEEPKKGCDVVEYHVYDIPGTNLINAERNEMLQSYKPLFEGTPIHIVETHIINSENELMETFEHFLADGYEGCMVRNMDGLYVNKRSYDLLKVKIMMDDEFEIVDVEEGKGTLTGHAGSFVCKTKEGNIFKVKMEGSFSMLKEYLNNFEIYRGKMLTVRFQDYTGKNNVPRFPIGVRIRYEE